MLSATAAPMDPSPTNPMLLIVLSSHHRPVCSAHRIGPGPVPRRPAGAVTGPDIKTVLSVSIALSTGLVFPGSSARRPYPGSSARGRALGSSARGPYSRELSTGTPFPGIAPPPALFGYI